MPIIRDRILKISFALLLAPVLCLCAVPSKAQNSPTPRIYAQQVVDETLGAHPEINTLELAATPPGKTQCVTVAANETKEIGGKCDKDEFTAIKTNKPFVEMEKENGKEVYDVTIPLHDAKGTIIATAGIEYKPGPNQSAAQVRELSLRLAKELEAKANSKEKLFEPAS